MVTSETLLRDISVLRPVSTVSYHEHTLDVVNPPSMAKTNTQTDRYAKGFEGEQRSLQRKKNKRANVIHASIIERAHETAKRIELLKWQEALTFKQWTLHSKSVLQSSNSKA